MTTDSNKEQQPPWFQCCSTIRISLSSTSPRTSLAIWELNPSRKSSSTIKRSSPSHYKITISPPKGQHSSSKPSCITRPSSTSTSLPQMDSIAIVSRDPEPYSSSTYSRTIAHFKYSASPPPHSSQNQSQNSRKDSKPIKISSVSISHQTQSIPSWPSHSSKAFKLPQN